MKKIALILVLIPVALTLSACGAARKRFESIYPGQTRDEVVKLMGNPDLFRPDGDQTLMVWQVDWMTGCGVFIDKDGRVTGKECRGADAPSPQTMRVPAHQPMPVYQMPVQKRTNCTTTGYGNTATTNCTSN